MEVYIFLGVLISIFVLADIPGWNMGTVSEVKIQYQRTTQEPTDSIATVEITPFTPGSSDGVPSLHTDLGPAASEWRCEERRRLPTYCLFTT